MKVNVLDAVTSYDGTHVQDGDTTLVFRSVFGTALNTSVQGEQLTADQKARMYTLTVKIYQNNEVELDSNEAAFLQERVGKIFGPLVYGRVCDLLNGRQQ